MADSDPLVLVLLRWLLRVLELAHQLFCSACWLLPALFCSYMLPALARSNPTSISQLTFRAIPRCFAANVGALMVPAILGTVLLQVWTIAAADSQTSAYLSTGVVGVLLLHGMYRGSCTSTLRCMECSMEFRELPSLAFATWLDFVVIAGAALTHLLFVRSCPMRCMLAARPLDFRSVCVTEGLRSLVYLAVSPCYILVRVTMWRSAPLHAALYPHGPSHPNEFVPQTIVFQSALLISDLVGFSFSIPVLLTVYRLPTLVRKLRDAPTVDDMPLLCVKECFQLVIDLPFVALAVAVTATLLRAPKLWRAVTAAEATAGSRRAAALKHFCMTVIELLLLALVFVTILPSVYRLPVIARIVSDKSIRSRERAKKVLDQIFSVFRDAPFFVVGVLSLAFIWRARAFFRSFCQLSAAEDRRDLAWRNLCEGCLDLPYFALAVADLLFVWRVPHLIRQLRAASTAAELEEALWSCFWDGVVDLPFIVVGIMDLAIFWRLSQAIRLLRTAENASERRQIVWDMLVSGVCDIPFVILGTASMVFIWRVPHALKVLYSNADADTRRRLVVRWFTLGLIDVPSTAAALLVLVTVYRLRNLSASRSTKHAGWDLNQSCLTDFHSVSFAQLWQLLIDAPFLLMGLIPVVAVWRAPWFLTSVQRLSSASERRSFAFRSALLTLADVPCFMGGLAVVFSGWRARPMLQRLKAGTSGPPGSWKVLMGWHTTVLVSVSKVVFELPCVPLMLTSLWRFPQLWRAICAWDDTNQEALDFKSALSVFPDVSRCKLAFLFGFLPLLDVAAVLAALVVTCSGWQTRAMWRCLQSKAYLSRDGDRLIVPSVIATHKEIFRHFFLFVRDIPLICLLAVSCLTFWRIPSVVAFVSGLEEASSSRQNMASASKLAVCAFLDPICALMIGFTLLTWRHHNARRIISDAIKADTEVGSFHRAAFQQFLQLLADIPFILVSPLTLWRFPFLICEGLSLPSAYQIRMRVPSTILLSVCDLISVAALMVTMIIPWRTLSVLGKTIIAIKETISPDSDFNKPAAVDVTKVTVFLPEDSDSHGLCVKVVGTKAADFVFDAAQLHLEGDIWTRITAMVGASAVSAAKLALHPVSLCPKFLDPGKCKAGSTEFDIEIRLATGPSQPRLSHKTLLKHVKTLLESDDCSFCIRVSYQGGLQDAVTGVASRGALFRFKLNVSDIEAGRREFTLEGSGNSKKLDLFEEACCAESPSEDEPCPVHVAALSNTVSTFGALPAELLALVLCILPPFLCTLPVLSILFGIGRWKVPDEERTAALWRSCKDSLLNLVSTVALFSCLLAPWNLLCVVRVVRTSIRAATWATYHRKTFRCVQLTVLNLPTDAIGLLCACLPPFCNLGEAFCLILSIGSSAVTQTRRASTLWNLSKQAVQDFKVLCIGLLVSLTLWRLPSLVSGLWECNTDDRFQTRGRRRAIRTVVEDTGLALLLDVLQLGQVVLITGTLVSFPSFFIRIKAHIWYCGSRQKDKATRQLHKLRLLSQKRPHPRWLEGESAHLGLLGAISEGVLTEFVMPQLDAPSLSLLGGCARDLHALSASNQYWIPLFKRHFHSTWTMAQVGSAHTSFIAAERARLGRQRIPQDQMDYQMGLRHVVHAEFLIALERLPHFFLLPLKLLSVAFIPVLLLLNLRYQVCNAPPTSSFWHQFFTPGPSFARLTGTASSFQDYDFWSAHLFSFHVLLLLVVAIGFEVGNLVALFNTALAVVCTAGLPILANLLPAWPPVRVTGVVITGVLLPVFVAVQLLILFLPLGSASWITTVRVESVMIWLSDISTEVFGELYTEISGLLSAVVSALPFGQITSAVSPYFSYWKPLADGLGLTTISHIGLQQAGNVISSVCVTSTEAFSAISFEPQQLTVHWLFPLFKALQLQEVLVLLSSPFDLLLQAELQMINSLWTYTIFKQLGAITWLLEWTLWVLSSKWTLQVIWGVIASGAVPKTWHILERLFPGIDPLAFYRWPIDFLQQVVRFIQRAVSEIAHISRRLILTLRDGYAAFLGVPTSVCARLGIVGDLLLIPIALAWMFWPLHVPFHMEQTSLLFSAVPLCCVLCSWGAKIIKSRWSSSKSKRD